MPMHPTGECQQRLSPLFFSWDIPRHPTDLVPRTLSTTVEPHILFLHNNSAGHLCLFTVFLQDNSDGRLYL